MIKSKNLRVGIVGGGYAGLAALITLRERSENTEITLIDPGSDHIKVTQVHESFRRPLEGIKLPFHLIEKRFSIRHLQTDCLFSEHDLGSCQSEREIRLGDGSVLPFDYLIVSKGTRLRTTAIEKSVKTLTLQDFIEKPGPELLTSHLGKSKTKPSQITVVGSGATGIQFLFEIAHYALEHHLPWKLRLIDSGYYPLHQFDPSMGRYVMAKLDEWGIQYHPDHYFLKQGESEVIIEHRESFERQTLESDLTLYFSGKNSRDRLKTNWYGQVKNGHQTLQRVFSAGDCAHFKSPGSNSLSAQSAVRKGKLVAQNILRQNSLLGLKSPYLHRDLGYVISMGPADAIGWVGTQKNIIAGSPALAVKNVVESQYDLLLAGTNTFAL
jgi:NADH dehydrogenase